MSAEVQLFLSKSDHFLGGLSNIAKKSKALQSTFSLQIGQSKFCVSFFPHSGHGYDGIDNESDDDDDSGVVAI